MKHRQRSSCLAGTLLPLLLASCQSASHSCAEPAGADRPRIVILGSSTAEGVGPKNVNDSWTNRFRRWCKRLRRPIEVINLARGGYTTFHILPTSHVTPDGRPQPDASRNVTAALDLHPDAIIVNLPSNDAAHKFPVAEQVANYRAVLAATDAAHVPVWIATTQPRGLDETGRAALQAMRDRTAQLVGDRTIDFWTKLAQPDGNIQPRYDSGDHVHLNRHGHWLLFQRVVTSTVVRLLYEEDASVSHAPPAERRGAAGEWQLAWGDDFDGAGIDDQRWEAMLGDGSQYGIPGWGNQELQNYRRENATLRNGMLVITARKPAHKGAPYTSARLRTRKDWRYGRFEMRAKLPKGRGLWPAFWMLPVERRYGEWPCSGEIDIMEFLGHKPRRVRGTLHFGGPWPAAARRQGTFELASDSFADEFHVFGVDWEPGRVTWHVDGEVYYTTKRWHTLGYAYPAPFDQRFRLLINLAVGGRLPGNPDATTTFPASMLVDWVRVWQRRRA